MMSFQQSSLPVENEQQLLKTLRLLNKFINKIQISLIGADLQQIPSFMEKIQNIFDNLNKGERYRLQKVQKYYNSISEKVRLVLENSKNIQKYFKQLQQTTSVLTNQILHINHLKEYHKIPPYQLQKIQALLLFQKRSSYLFQQQINKINLINTGQARKLFATHLNSLHQIIRKINNEIQNGKKNVRIICRIKTAQHLEKRINYKINKTCQIITIFKPRANLSRTIPKCDNRQFYFYRIFGVGESQQAIFQQVYPMILLVTQRTNDVIILAYGQTASGKTYTIQGTHQNQSQRGVIPRSIQTVYKELARIKRLGLKGTVSIHVSQIYNQKIYNIMKQRKQVKVNLPQFDKVNTLQEMEEIIRLSTTKRTIGCTLKNSQSSRSHLIIIIKFEIVGDEVSQKNLILVDLAGNQKCSQIHQPENVYDKFKQRQKFYSQKKEKRNKSSIINQTNHKINEKRDKSNVKSLSNYKIIGKSQLEQEKIRQEESKNINKSLIQLGKVIRNQYMEKEKEKISFRNSTLTHFLAPYFKDNTKILMILTASQALQNESATLHTLKFGSIKGRWMDVAL